MVSDDFFGKEVRAIGGVQSCPDDEKNWNVWDGEDFTAPDLPEPWSPIIELITCLNVDLKILR